MASLASQGVSSTIVVPNPKAPPKPARHKIKSPSITTSNGATRGNSGGSNRSNSGGITSARDIVAQLKNGKPVSKGNTALTQSRLWSRFEKTSVLVESGVLCKDRAEPEFAVGVMAAGLENAIKPLEWEVLVERTGRAWCGVGVAVRDVELGESLRQCTKGSTKAGRAWFYHDRGFLCNGEVIVDDEVSGG